MILADMNLELHLSFCKPFHSLLIIFANVLVCLEAHCKGNVGIFVKHFVSSYLLVSLFTYLVFSKVFCIFLVIFSMALCLFPSGRRSILFRTTTIFWQAICPITKHSADCVCIPFVTSITSIIKSIIWAPGGELTVSIATA